MLNEMYSKYLSAFAGEWIEKAAYLVVFGFGKYSKGGAGRKGKRKKEKEKKKKKGYGIGNDA